MMTRRPFFSVARETSLSPTAAKAEAVKAAIRAIRKNREATRVRVEVIFVLEFSWPSIKTILNASGMHEITENQPSFAVCRRHLSENTRLAPGSEISSVLELSGAGWRPIQRRREVRWPVRGRSA